MCRLHAGCMHPAAGRCMHRPRNYQWENRLNEPLRWPFLIRSPVHV